MDNVEFSKVCTKCKIDKPFCDFGKNSRIKSGTFNSCKLCVNLKNKQLILSNPEKYKESSRKWIIDNKEKNENYKKKWLGNNKEKRREWARVNKRKRYKTEIKYKLTQNIRNRMGSLFKKTPLTKSLMLLGCSVDEYKVHLESMFQAGMTWENHAFYGWHIDHIIPIDSFDLTDESQLRKAFHYTNTQPLWASDNLKKKDKLNYKVEHKNA